MVVIGELLYVDEVKVIIAFILYEITVDITMLFLDIHPQPT
jgi:hypothetical protein